MDVPRLLRLAREHARLSRSEVAARACTSTSAISAYERGLRSPTVATLDRLLAACDLQVRGALEPLLADVDELVDSLYGGGPGELAWGTDRCAAELARVGAPHAFDGQTALVLHGLAGRPAHVEIAAPDSSQLRMLLHRWGSIPVTTDGRDLYDSWLVLDIQRVGPARMYSGFAFFSVRVVEDLPPLVHVENAGTTYPVLTLPDLELAHPSLADVLARLRQRRGLEG